MAVIGLATTAPSVGERAKARIRLGNNPQRLPKIRRLTAVDHAPPFRHSRRFGPKSTKTQDWQPPC